MTQLDLDLGRALRDAGIERVLRKKNFRLNVRHYVYMTPKGTEMTGEDIRVGCEAVGIKAHHANAWGGVISGLIKAGLLIKTGRYTQMKDPRSHARATQILRRA